MNDVPNIRKIRAPIKIKSALPPPPPQNPKYPPPKTRNFMDTGFPAERTHFFQVSIKLVRPFPAPELRTRILWTRGFFWLLSPLEKWGDWVGCKKCMLKKFMSFFPPYERTQPQKKHYGIVNYPKDPAVLKILRVVNLLRVVFLVRRDDLLSRRTLCGHHFPGNYRGFSFQRRAHGVVNLGGVVKTLRHSNSLFVLSS